MSSEVEQLREEVMQLREELRRSERLVEIARAAADDNYRRLQASEERAQELSRLLQAHDSSDLLAEIRRIMAPSPARDWIITEITRLREALAQAERERGEEILERFAREYIESYGCDPVMMAKGRDNWKTRAEAANTALAEAIARNASLAERVAALEEGLRPFANYAGHVSFEIIRRRAPDAMTERSFPGHFGEPSTDITTGDFRRARSLLQSPKEEGP